MKRIILGESPAFKSPLVKEEGENRSPLTKLAARHFSQMEGRGADLRSPLTKGGYRGVNSTASAASIRSLQLPLGKLLFTHIS